jgi:hypothetical protein
MRDLIALAALLCTAVVIAQPAPPPAPLKPWEAWQPPAVVLPNPNGFDTYLKAFALKDEIDKAHGLGRMPQPPGGAAPPAAAGEAKAGPPWPATGPPFPLPAGAAPTFAGGPADPLGWGEGPPELPLDQRVALYADVLKLCRQAMTQECRIPPPKGADDIFPFLAKWRAVARLFAMESAAYRDKGDFAAAANSALDCIEMAQGAATHRTLIGYLVSIACEAIGARQFDQAIPQLDAAASKAALVRLQAIETKRVPIVEIIDGEDRAGRLAFKQIAAMPDPAAALGGITDDPNGAAAKLRTLNWADSWQALGDYYAQLREAAKQPYAARMKPIRSDDPFVSILMPVWSRVWFKDAQCRAASQLRLARLAAQTFALERGRMPGELANLVPGYLPKVPDDPFGNGPLKSLPAGHALLIYSIGPDGVDDNGAPILDPIIKEDSKGDVVVKVEAIAKP